MSERALAIVASRALRALEAPPVRVEVHVAGGLPRTTVVGLPETVVRESTDRVRSAIRTSGFRYPGGRITVSLAPAELPKEGGRFDLPIAIGILGASGQVATDDLGRYELLGELGLDGAVRPVRGALPCSVAARGEGRILLVPRANAREAAAPAGARVLGVETLSAVVDLLQGRGEPELEPSGPRARPPASAEPGGRELTEVRGQWHAKRALEVALSGGHHLLMAGPPGTGKTMLAMRVPGLLPPLEEDEALETAAVYSVAGEDRPPEQWYLRPFRAPHHTISAAGLVGGGRQPRPGEISLVHNGVLFLDELGEFSRSILESLREPLESGRVTVSRAGGRADFPARFQLFAAMNPCPCGYLGDGSDRCGCSLASIRRYQGRISGPLLDRIDLQLALARAPLPGPESGEPEPAGEGSGNARRWRNASVRERVARAREQQMRRQGVLNACLSGAELERHAGLGQEAKRLLERAARRFELSERAVDRIRRVARTIADLQPCPDIASQHLAEALSYRQLERQGVRSAPVPGRVPP